MYNIVNLHFNFLLFIVLNAYALYNIRLYEYNILLYITLLHFLHFNPLKYT